MQETCQKRSEINVALTLFCIFKITSIKKDPKYMCVHSTFSHQAQGFRYGNDRVVTYEVFAGLCTSSTHKPAPKTSMLCAGPINLAGEREAWKQHSILRNYSQKGAKSSQGESGEGETRTPSSQEAGWKQCKTSWWLTSLHIIRKSFQLRGKSLFALSAQMPP